LLVDLPGVHSTSATSPEEELSCGVIEGRHHSVTPELLVVAVDATQLERHLKLASFVARQDKPTIIALTMMDLLARSRQTVNVRKLEAALGVPVIPVDGRTGWGADSSTKVASVCSIATDATVYCVVEGKGAVRIGDNEFLFEPHDVFVAPSWAPVQLSAVTESVLFSYFDRPVLAALNLLREERA